MIGETTMNNIKKSYNVPQVSFEDFEVNMKIAGVCSGVDWMAELNTTLSYFNSSEVGCYLFLDSAYNPLTGEKIDGDYKTLCYNTIGSIHGS